MKEQICIGRDCDSTHFILEGQSMYCAKCTVHYTNKERLRILKFALKGEVTFSYARSYNKKLGQGSTHRLREWARSLRVKPVVVREMMVNNNLI